MELQLLEITFEAACREAEIHPEDMGAIKALLAPLKAKNLATRATYAHCLRVALVGANIARHLGVELRPVLFAGSLHDAGKAQVLPELLGETRRWSTKHQRAIEAHVMHGYRLLRGRFDFTAEIILLHHIFQRNPYPRRLPLPLHGYSPQTRQLIMQYGRLLALADVYDALHRTNSRFGRKLTPVEIRQQMLAMNPDLVMLVSALYDAKIFGSPETA